MSETVVAQKKPRRSGLVRLLRSVATIVVLSYAFIVIGMVIMQRTLLFNERGHQSALDAASGIAIPGSQKVTIATPDGERLDGWYRAPSQPGAPVFLFFHGQGGGLIWQVTRWAELRQRGYGVLAISYRGYSNSTGRPSEAGLAIDAKAAYDWLAQKHAPREIVIHGHSLGSGVASKLATTVEARALVLEAPFTAASDVGAERFPWLPVQLLMFDSFRSRDWIGDVKMPVLIVHGDADTVIPVSHGQRLAALVKSPKEFVRVRGGIHNGLSRQGLYDHVASFLGKHPVRR
jgi:uncharacterized protein